MNETMFEDSSEEPENGDQKTLRGTISRVIFQADDSDYAVVQLRPSQGDGDSFTAVGSLIEPLKGQEIEVTGEWTRHSKYGRQFQVDFARVVPPSTEDGIRQYLADYVSGIGPELAKRIVEEFGEATFTVIEQDPSRLRGIPGIGAAKLKTVRESWQKHQHAREIMAFLSEQGVTPAYATRIYDRYGEQAISILREEPYRLAREVHGVGFKTADRIARNMGVSVSHPGRWEAGLLYVLEQAEEDGHCFLPVDRLLERGAEELEGTREKVNETVQRLSQNGDLIVDPKPTSEENPAVYRSPLYHTEVNVAQRLGDVARAVPHWTSNTVRLEELDVSFPVDYNPEQRNAIERALSGDVLILTGGPGTGKTTTVRGMIQALEAYDRNFALAAPTGRAAKRLSTSTDRPASTIHRLLEYSPDAGFQRNADDPLDVDVVIVDETSMVDIHLMYSLLEALRDITGLVMVGDSDQLPSVGSGNVLQDCMDSGCLSTVRLTEIYRQARRSGIVMNAHRLNRGEGFKWSGFSDFIFVEQSDAQRVHETIVRYASKELPERTGLDRMRDIQVLSPMKEGPAGVHRLNEDLQDALNPDRNRDRSLKYHVGDKVMQTSNNYENEVFNGDIGFVEAYREKRDVLLVSFPDLEERVEYDESMRRRELQLSYAITVHKSQGSEYPMVVMPVLKRHYVMLKRPLLYTAMTRAEVGLVMVGQKQAVHIAKNRTESDRRWTGLSGRIKSAFNGETRRR